MGLLADCEELFAAKDLYQVLNVPKTASATEIKKAYRKLSLVHHPDRHEAADSGSKSKEQMTRSFQVLSKVHYLLSDEEKRKVYDQTGIVDDEDVLDENADWESYFRNLFPKIKRKDVDSFMDKYIGSQEEIDDLKKYYCQFDGDMDKIEQCVIGFEEERHREMIQKMIDDGDLPQFDAFVNESQSKKNKRLKAAAREAKAAKKVASKLPSDDDLVNAIQSRSKGSFDDMISKLEAKYANPSSGSKKKQTKSKK